MSKVPVSPHGPNSEELFELAQEAGRIGLFEWNVREGSVHLSATFLSIYELEKFDGRFESWLKCVHREDQVRISHLIDTNIAGRQRNWHAEFRIVGPRSGELKWVEARNLVFYDPEGRALRVVGVTVDVTERKRAESRFRAFTDELEEAVKARTRELEIENEARRRAEELLRQAQKMEAIGQLTGGVAHDFNNLLTIVLGGLETIARQLPLLQSSPAVLRIVRAKDMALNGVHRAEMLTSRLLAFARQQPLAPKSVDANKLVAGICDLLQRTLGEAISLETVLAAGLWRMEADPNQLENAILNLALNARDAMPDGGKVTVETANSYLDSPYVANLSEPVEEGQYVMIAVTDTGSGMDKATQDRAFDPFFTTKETGKGTGLGLSQVYGFVRQSSGHVRIYSELGQGTTVKVYLRRSASDEDSHNKEASVSDVPRAIGTETILVVEDDEALRMYSVEILSELGYQVFEAKSGPTALEVLNRVGIDLLFTDVVMPDGMNGRQLADEVKQRWPKLKILFTTGYSRNAIVHHGKLDAGIDLIGKPFTFGELGTKVREILDR